MWESTENQVGKGLRRPLLWRPPGLARRRRAGVTVIEVLAASAILGIGLVGVGSLVTYGVVSQRKSQHYTVASARVTQELERIREAGYTGAVVETALFPSPDYTIVNSAQVSFTIPELPNGTGLITVGEDPEAQATNPTTGLPYLNLKKVSVAVSWSGGHSLSGSYQAVTLIANRPA